MRPLFSGKQELLNLDYYFQDGGKMGAQTNQSFLKIKQHILMVTHYYKRLKFYDQIIFWSGCILTCFPRAVSDYVGEN